MASVKDITAATELSALIARGTVLVEFWAPWCGVCKTMGIVLEQLAVSAPAEVVIAKVNVDEAKDLAAEFAVTTVPQMFLFREGQEVSRFGAVSKGKLLELLGI